MERETSNYYDSAALRWPLLEELKELTHYRDLLLLLVLNSIKTRYKRSYFGIAWTMLNPLLYTGVMTFAFTNLFRSSVANYPIYILAGMICWIFFTQTTMMAMNALVGGGSLIRRIYVPRTIFAIASVGNGLVNLLLTLIPLLVVMLIMEHPLHDTWWFLPIAVFLLAMFSLGISLLLSTLAAYFIDVVDMYQIIIQALFFFTPIFYPKDILPAQFQSFMSFNPIYHLVEIFRAPVYAGTLPDVSTVLTAAMWSALTLIAGLWVFTRKADEFAYRI